MSTEFYQKLVDLYAGRELPQELEDELEWASFAEPDLSHDMGTLRRTVDLLKHAPGPEFTEESYQRILMKMYAKGLEFEPISSPPTHMQLGLPIQG
jgi:hypothetical protein